MNHPKYQQQTTEGPCDEGCTIARHSSFDKARLSWPGVHLSCGQFQQHLQSVGYIDDDSADLSALYLCAGCALGLRSACWALERRYFPSLRGTIGRLVRELDGTDDVMQEVRYRLLVGPSPKIATYRGSGPLSAWLRAIAVHAALDHRRARAASRQRWKGLCRELDCYVSRHTAASCPEETAFKGQCSGACQEVLRVAISSLDGEERQLLRYRFVSGFNIDMIGQVYAINRATAARRIHRSVKRIRQRARAELSAHFGRQNREELNDLVNTLYEHFNVDAVDLAQS